MRVTRVIIYDGEEAWILKTLENSVLKKRGSRLKTPFGEIKLISEVKEDGSYQGSRKSDKVKGKGGEVGK